MTSISSMISSRAGKGFTHSCIRPSQSILHMNAASLYIGWNAEKEATVGTKKNKTVTHYVLSTRPDHKKITAADRDQTADARAASTQPNKQPFKPAERLTQTHQQVSFNLLDQQPSRTEGAQNLIKEHDIPYRSYEVASSATKHPVREVPEVSEKHGLMSKLLASRTDKNNIDTPGNIHHLEDRIEELNVKVEEMIERVAELTEVATRLATQTALDKPQYNQHKRTSGAAIS